MRKLIIGLLVSLVSAGVLAQTPEQDKYRLVPTPDPRTRDGVSIPKDLEDSFVELRKMLHPLMLDEMKESTEQGMIRYHMGLGLWIRNFWIRAPRSRLKDYFNRLGLFHPDDISGVILTSFWRHLHAQSIELEEQIKYHQAYWQKLRDAKMEVIEIPESALKARLKTLQGATYRLADDAGRIAVISLWSTDADDSLMRSLALLQPELAAKGVAVVGLVLGDQAKEALMVKRLARRLGIKYRLVWDEERVAEAVMHEHQVLPQLVVISRDGRVLKRLDDTDEVRGGPITVQLRRAVRAALQ
jgi:hypothetical protein